MNGKRLPSPSFVLASSSRYRGALLTGIGLEFSTRSPNCDETARTDEPPADLALRLGIAKATAVAASQPRGTEGPIVIGSDQVLSLAGRALGKPGNRERAIAQLTACSERWVTAFTSVSLVDCREDRTLSALERYEIRFRKLSRHTIERYLDRDQPYDCAGSIKAEGLGVTLLEEGRGRDVNTLYGLPLMRLVTLLGECGIDIP